MPVMKICIVSAADQGGAQRLPALGERARQALHGEAGASGERADLPFGVGGVVELARPVLVAEEHGLQNPPTLIERAAAAGVVVGVTDDVEVAPFVLGVEEGGADPLEIR